MPAMIIMVGKSGRLWLVSPKTNSDAKKRTPVYTSGSPKQNLFFLIPLAITWYNLAAMFITAAKLRKKTRFYTPNLC